MNWYPWIAITGTALWAAYFVDHGDWGWAVFFSLWVIAISANEIVLAIKNK